MVYMGYRPLENLIKAVIFDELSAQGPKKKPVKVVNQVTLIVIKKLMPPCSSMSYES